MGASGSFVGFLGTFIFCLEACWVHLGACWGDLAASWGGRVVLLLAVGFIVLWIHPFGQVKSNIRTNLGQPESGRLRFPLKICWGR